MKIALASSKGFELTCLPYLISEDFVEIGAHDAKVLEDIENGLKRRKIGVLGIHAPCPNLMKGHPNLGDPKNLQGDLELIFSSFETARRLGAKKITLHPFYSFPKRLPITDSEKEKFFKNQDREYSSLSKFRESVHYEKSLYNAAQALKDILERSEKKYSDISICLENLNPVIGYGMQAPSEFLKIWEYVRSPRLMMDLDFGHLYLSSRCLSFSMEEEIKTVRKHIGIVSLSQNHGGVYCTDRNLGEKNAQYQNVDLHFPFHGKARLVREISEQEISRKNLAFKKILKGVVVFDEKGDLPTGTLPYRELLSLLEPELESEQAHVVLEYAPEYAPVGSLLDSYWRFRQEFASV